jgi:hypothetical protein
VTSIVLQKCTAGNRAPPGAAYSALYDRARLLNEGEILIGQRQDRDLREVDFLLARDE